MNNKHILIIGGTKGIGNSIAQYFNKSGSHISVIGQTKPDSIPSLKNKITYFQADITNIKKMQETINTIVKSNGRLTCLIFTQRYRGDSDSWAGELDVSLSATKNIIEFCKNKFDSSLEKSIVIIGSVLNSFVAYDQPAGYHVGKTALLGLVRFYGVILGKIGLRINMVSPGAVLKNRAKVFYEKNKSFSTQLTKSIPLGKMATPEDIAKVVAFLCSSDSSYITGQNIIVDGGLSLLAQENLIWNISQQIGRAHEGK